MARILQCLPGRFQEQPLLRIEHLRFPRRDAEEAGIELVHIFDNAACRDIGGVRARGHVIGVRRLELIERRNG